MTQHSEVLYVQQLAQLLGRSEAAIRAAANRQSAWLPPPFPMGRRLAWRRSDVDKFLAEQAKKVGR